MFKKLVLVCLLLGLVTPAHAGALANLACMSTATSGTGTITLGSAVTGFLSFADAGVANAQVVSYSIEDGNNSEVGRGTYTTAGTTLSRTVINSTNGGSAISLSGTATVCISDLTIDFYEWSQAIDANGFNLTEGGTFDLVGVNFGSAQTDTTVTRSAAGVIAVEGADVAELSTAQTWTATQTMRTINPSADSTYSLGASGTEWLAASIDTVTVTTLELGGAATTDTSIARSAAGEATLEGDAVKHAGKQMFWVPAAAMRNSALSPASCGDTYDSGTNDVTVTVCAFDTGATEENAEFGFAMPKSSNESTITMQFAWTNTGGSAAQTVQWKIACTGFGDDDALNTAYPADVTVSDTFTATNDYTLTAETSAITVQNLAEGDWVNCRIGRDTSADNLGGDALLMGAKVYWTDNASTMAE